MEASWSSFNATMQVDHEDSELLAQLLGTYEGQSLDIPSVFWPADPSADSYYCPQDLNASLCYWPEDTSLSFSTSADCRSSCYLGQPNVVDPAMGGATSSPMDFGMGADYQMAPSSSSMEFISLNKETSSEVLGDLCMNVPDQQIVLCDQKPMQLKRKLHVELDDCNASRHEIPDSLVESPKKKKAQASSQVQKSVESAKLMKAQKTIKSGEEDENNVAPNGHGFSSYSSEEDSNISQELSIGGIVSTGPKGPAALSKTRAGRGSATDPQSLYARKRRERINERLRILQNLVPNGTKVDISTMLEEAVQYVKFLQLQIKLLSSDEMWMYAPIAYNGINIGFDLNMTPAKQ